MSAIDHLQIWWWIGPSFRKQPDSPPQPTSEHEPTQPCDAKAQYAHGSSRCAQMATTQWRRSETTGSYAQLTSVFNPRTICKDPQRCHRQHQPMTTDPLRFRPAGLVPLPPNALDCFEAHLYPEAKSIPARSGFIGLQVRHHDTWLVPADLPDHDHRSTTAFGPCSERSSVPYVCMSRPWYQRSRRQTGACIGTEYGVDRLSRIWMPSQRAYLLPQPRTPQAAVVHHQHRHGLRDRRRQQLQQTHNRGYPSSGPVGVQNVPGNRDGAAAVDHAYDDGVYSVAMHRRVYSQDQPVRLPPCKQPSQQRDKARSDVQLHSAGAGAVTTVIEPLPEVLAQTDVAAHSCEGGRNGVLAGTLGQDGPVHPEHQSHYLRLSEVRHVMLNGLLHLVAFIWKAHGDSPATFLLVPKRCQTAMRFPTSFVLLLYFTYPYQPIKGEGLVVCDPMASAICGSCKA